MAKTDLEANLLEAVLAMIGDPVLITDDGGIVTRVNQAFITATGLTAEQVIGLPLAAPPSSPPPAGKTSPQLRWLCVKRISQSAISAFSSESLAW